MVGAVNSSENGNHCGSKALERTYPGKLETSLLGSFSFYDPFGSHVGMLSQLECVLGLRTVE